MNIELKVLDPQLGVVYPSYATCGSAGIDLCAGVQKPVILYPGASELIPTGIAIHIKTPKLMGMIVPRSGLGHKYGVVLGNGTGIIDADYQGEIMISAFNRGRDAYKVNPKDRIAQMIFVPVVRAEFVVVEEFSTTTNRGEGGFGSTGLQ